MTILVSVSTHDNRVALKIESGEHAGEFVSTSLGVQHFVDENVAILWASNTGYTVIKMVDENVIPEVTELTRTIGDVTLPKGAYVVSRGDKTKSEIIAEFCKTNGIELINVDPAIIDPIDLTGIPVPREDGTLHWANPILFTIEPNRK